jgi:ATP-dependent Clp protease ATP-binding subunit ClpA
MKLLNDIGEEVPITPRMNLLLELSSKHTQNMNCKYIGTEMVLLGMVDLPDSIVLRTLQSFGVNKETVTKAYKDHGIIDR